ncbi:MAG TPA: DUF397 domain-containing protein [Candidatus Brocadiaceae bacterium]
MKGQKGVPDPRNPGQYTEHPDLFKDRDFVKSSASQPGSIINCVAVAHKAGVIGVRSNRDANKKTLFFDKGEWGAFIQGVKNGEFDFKS